MGTVKQLLDVARSQIGVKESPKNSNIVIFNDWYWGKGKYGNWAAWCEVFVAWCCDRANVKLPVRTASCGELMRAAQKANMWVVRDFKPGDLVIFDWSGKQKITDHIGIVESVLPDYGVTTIEGNTSVSDNSNGGEVMRRNRAYKYIIGAVRPVYDAEIKQEDVSKMTIAEFVDKLTDEQAYALLQKAQKHAATLPLPNWAEKEMKESIDIGITDGSRPMALTSRYEAAIMTKRSAKK